MKLVNSFWITLYPLLYVQVHVAPLLKIEPKFNAIKTQNLS